MYNKGCFLYITGEKVYVKHYLGQIICPLSPITQASSCHIGQFPTFHSSAKLVFKQQNHFFTLKKEIQSGFHARRGTETALVKVVNGLRANSDAKQLSVLGFIKCCIRHY
jgi:hypothetical protein